MQYCLTQGLARLDLHDSSLETCVRQGDTIELVFDWAKLADFIEHNVREPIIMGITTIVLTGVRAEKLSIYDDGQGTMKPLFVFEIINDLELIISNNLSETTQSMEIAGMLTATAGSQWLEWRLAFTTCTVSWQAFITSAEWQSGLLPPG